MIDALAVMVDEAPPPRNRTTAAEFFVRHRERGFRILGSVPWGNEFVQRAADSPRQQNLIDEAEVNDSLVLAEAAAMDCSIRLTSDEHLRGVDYERLMFAMRRFDLSALVIATPREIVKNFPR